MVGVGGVARHAAREAHLAGEAFMSKETKIQWCDSTINFWRGCTKVSAGCAHCYAEKNIGVKMSGIEWGKGKPRVKTKGAVADAFALNRKPWICNECGAAYTEEQFNSEDATQDMCSCVESCHRRRIFSLSLGDWLDPEVPIEWLAEMLDTIRHCDQVIWILCTKRPELWYARMGDVLEFEGKAPLKQIENDFPATALGEWVNDWSGGKAPKNIWLLTSVENQPMADQRIPELLKIPATVHGLSCEPLLGPLQIERYLGEVELESYSAFNSSASVTGGIEWLIVGGESGKDARACNVEWIRELVKQGQAARCATFVKQLGANSDHRVNGAIHAVMTPVGIECEHGYDVCPKCDGGRQDKMWDKKGGDLREWPEQLRVRQFPEVL
jgi:protein gp37